MPSFKTHCEIAELYGIDEYVCNEVNKIIDTEGNIEGEWKSIEGYIKIKKLEYLTDNGEEVKGWVKENWWHHDCRKIPLCFFIKAQTAYDNFGDEGLKAYFLHHALDIVHYFRCPKYFGIEIEILPELTRRQEKERYNWAIYGFSRKGICLYKLRDYTLAPESQDLQYICFHILTLDVFQIEGDFKESNISYRFNDRVIELIEGIKWFLQDNISKILEMIYNNDCKKGKLGEL